VLLTISSTHEPSDELGYLLAKHPNRVHSVELPFGTATVCFPEVGRARTTAALIVHVDPVGLVRRAAGVNGSIPDGFALGQHVNDRPYSASSLLSVAISRSLGSALGGRSRERPELAATPIPLELGVPAVRDADNLAATLFGPLGWRVERNPVGPVHAELRLSGTHRLAEALAQVYVLLPVLDDNKHYPVGAAEAEKLLRGGGEWLTTHPERELITRRYLRYRRRLISPMLQTLGVGTGETSTEETDTPPTPLRQRRRDAVLAQLRQAGAHRVLDLGCGDGALLAELVKDASFTEIVGVDASAGALSRAERRLRLDELAPSALQRLTLLHGALTYADKRLVGYDAAVLMEVIEHVDERRLPALRAAVFGTAAPGTVLVTTPNREYNVKYPDLPEGAFRHPDHRFEWDRARFGDWCSATAAEHGYRVHLHGIGDVDPLLGSPTQLAVFSKGTGA
jgi:3' terminal RNA ribose 2'-O-methyltransferase Hen1